MKRKPKATVRQLVTIVSALCATQLVQAQFFTPGIPVTPTVLTNNRPIIVDAGSDGTGTGVSRTFGGAGIYIGKGSQNTLSQNGYNIAIGAALTLNLQPQPLVLNGIPLASLQATSSNGNPGIANYNIAIGNQALRSTVTGSGHTAIGQEGVLQLLTTGNENTSIGKSSLSTVITGSRNCALGVGTMSNLAFGDNNVGIGAGAQVQFPGTSGSLASNQLSIQNTIWGRDMGGANSSIGIAAQPVSHNGGPNFAKLYVGGNTGTSPSLQLTGVPTLANPGVYFLYVDPTTGVVKQGTPTGTGTGIGSNCTTAGFVPRVTNSTGTGSLGCSQITDDGTNTVQIGTGNVGIVKFTTPGGAFSVYGAGATSSLPSQTIIASGTPYKLFVQGWTASTGYVALSDKRLKKEIKKIESPLSRISKLGGYTYKWNDENFAGKKLDENRQAGFLAQEVEAILPEAVVKNDDGTYGINYNAIMPLLTEGIKEQQVQIDKLTVENANFKLEITELKNKLNQLIPGDVKIKINSLEVSPNPLTGTSVVSYKLDNANAASFLVISDLQGRLLKKISLAKNQLQGQVQVNSKDLPNGIYVFAIVSGNTEVQSKKVLVAAAE